MNSPLTFPSMASPAGAQDVLSSIVVLSMMLQAEVALAPDLPPRDGGLGDPERWLDEHWQVDADRWWAEQSPVLGEQLRALLALQVRFRALRRGSPRQDIEALLPEADPVWATVSLHTDAGEKVRIPGFLALSHNLYDDEEPFVLYGLGAGVWFDNRQRMTYTLLDYLRTDRCWTRGLSAQARASLADATSAELSLRPLQGPAELYLLDDMRSLQRRLVIDGLAASRDDNETAVALAPLFEQLQGTVADAVGVLRKDQTPHWLRYLPPGESEQLTMLHQAVIETETQLAEQSQHSDFYAYARQRLGHWLAAKGFPELSAEKVQLHLRHDFTADAPRHMVSLLEWVCGGAYHGKHLTMEISHEGLRNALGDKGVSLVADELQLHRGYAEHVEQTYKRDEIRQLLGKALNAKLQLAKQAADFQGLDRKAVRLLEQAAQNTWAQSSDKRKINVARLSINGKMCLTDHLYIYNDDIHVLYAPGSPSGDLQAFNSSGHMSFALGALSATPAGRDYLVKHVRHADRPALTRYLKLVARLPQEWSHETINVHPQDVDGWYQVIQHWTEQRVMKVLDDLEEVRPVVPAKPDETLQRRVNDIDHELRVLMTDYQAAAEVPTFMAYARERVSERINRYPGNKGGWIDADTVLVELEDGVRQSLTQVVASGYPADFNFRDFARLTSAVGQNLSHLDNRAIDGYIRAARLGEGYCAEIRKSYLDPEGDAQSRPLELHRHITGMKIQRDCLVELQSGRLEEHVDWLKPVCMAFHRDSFVTDCKLAMLKLNGAAVVGGYLLQSSEAKGTLVYLSDGPGGRHLFTVADFIEQWQSDAMQDWIFEHVSVDDELLIRELNEDVRKLSSNASGDKANDRIARSLQVLYNIRDLSVALRQRIKRLLADAERDAYSAAKRITQEVFWLVGLVADAIALAFPPARIVLGFIKAGQGFYRSLVALRDGDKTAALLSLLRGVASLPGFTEVVKLYGTQLFDRGSKLWSTLFPGESSALSVWVKKQFEVLKAFYERHEVFKELGSAGIEPLNNRFEEELSWYTQLVVSREKSVPRQFT
ncbi:dermonecrotic toxin domain-containing protein [Pseudomonas putida]|uniref:dermonecrotic toxin domain-containing protein n=1 Tax=Pseudomonas putida TaxID=303 RepID=UPI00301C69CC